MTAKQRSVVADAKEIIDEPQRGTGGMSVAKSRAVYPLIPTSVANIEELAAFMLRAGAIPKSYFDKSIADEKTANAVAMRKAGIAIMKGLEIGWLPMQSVQNMYVINGIPTIYGDGAMAIARSSGLLVDAKEYFEGEGDGLRAVCELYRAGQSTPIVRTFSRLDAAKANLLGKHGPWKEYPHRMMQMRARSWAIRDGFADALMGLRIKEEVDDYEREDQPKSAVNPFASDGKAQIEGPAKSIIEAHVEANTVENEDETTFA